MAAQVTDYVDRGICFTHPEVEWQMRFSSDYDWLCNRNRKSDSDEVYSYWPESCMYTVDHDVVTRLYEGYMDWNVARNRLEPKIVEWAAACGRIFSVFPELPMEQLSFAHRHYTTTFFMDDPYERSCRKGTGNSFGRAYLHNLRLIFQGETTGWSDLKCFQSDRTPSVDVEVALFALDIVKENRSLGERVLSRDQFDFHLKTCYLWLDFLSRESKSFEDNVSQGSVSGYSDLLGTRHITCGFELVIAGVLPSATFTLPLITPLNPFVHLAAVVVAMDNDIVSVPKERKSGEDQESPSNFFFTIRNREEDSDMRAVRQLLHRRNAMVKCLHDQIMMMPPGWKHSYLNLLKYTMSICDFEYVLGHGSPNPRYGFVWHDTA